MSSLINYTKSFFGFIRKFFERSEYQKGNARLILFYFIRFIIQKYPITAVLG